MAFFCVEDPTAGESTPRRAALYSRPEGDVRLDTPGPPSAHLWAQHSLPCERSLPPAGWLGLPPAGWLGLPPAGWLGLPPAGWLKRLTAGYLVGRGYHQKKLFLVQTSGCSRVYNDSTLANLTLAPTKRHMNIAKPLMVAVALASLSLPACGGVAGEDGGGRNGAAGAGDGNIVCRQGRSPTTRSPQRAHHNALTHNALTQNALTHNALTHNALTHNALTHNALSDPDARELLSYIVSCALPANESVDIKVDGVDYTYQGQLGVAPEWGTPNGQCNDRCQGWVLRVPARSP